MELLNSEQASEIKGGKYILCVDHEIILTPCIDIECKTDGVYGKLQKEEDKVR